MDLKIKLCNIPQLPGVYFMKDCYNNIVYVGKSKNLNNRVRQYFTDSANHSDKVKEMVSRIVDFDIHVTDTELDALLYENEIIKKISPMYNSKMKKYKGYPYIKVVRSGRDSRISMTTECVVDGAMFFGPYTSKGCVEIAVDFINSYFGLRMCSRKNAQRGGCLNFQLRLCDGLCRVESTDNDYEIRADRVLGFLSGKDPIPSSYSKDLTVFFYHETFYLFYISKLVTSHNDIHLVTFLH